MTGPRQLVAAEQGEDVGVGVGLGLLACCGGRPVRMLSVMMTAVTEISPEVGEGLVLPEVLLGVGVGVGLGDTDGLGVAVGLGWVGVLVGAGDGLDEPVLGRRGR